jgi:hypothetical protein
LELAGERYAAVNNPEEGRELAHSRMQLRADFAEAAFLVIDPAR